MSAERWQRLRALYDQAIDATPGERDRLVQHVSESDPDLAGELRGLLVASDSDTSFLDTPLARLAPPEFEPGAVLCDRFEIRRRIGRGGMGDVWSAHDRQLQEDVALKTIRPGAVGDDRALARFKREIQLARRIAHPSVCRVHELFEDSTVSPSRFFLTMELLEGETLGDRLKRAGAIPPPEALAIAGEVAAGLAAAHDAGVVHRDLKPANIMLLEGASHRRAVILDFGLARSDMTPTLSGGSTVAGAIVGTPEYMAPEQISNGDVTPATDVYALGLILFEMLRGRRAFDAASTLESWMRRAREGPERLSGIVPGVAARIDQVIARCLEYDPARRYPTARELSRALMSAPFVTLPVSPRRLGWVAAAVIVVSALAGAGAWVWTRVPPPPRAVLEGYEEALEALAEGAIVRARNLILRVIEDAPEWAPAYAALAEIQLELEMPSLAQEAMLLASDRGRAARLDAADRLHVEGMRALLIRECDTAIEAFSGRARAADLTRRPYRMVTTARAMERCDRPIDARKEMEAAALLDPRNAAVMLARARLAARAGDSTQAVGLYAAAEQLFRDRNVSEGIAETLIGRGTFEVQRDQPDRAGPTLTQAWGMASSMSDWRQQIRILLQQAILLRRGNDPAGATAKVSAALEIARRQSLDTLSVEGLFGLANLAVSGNRFGEARTYFEEIVRIAATYRHDEFKARAELSLVNVYIRLLQPGRAQESLDASRSYYERTGRPGAVATAAAYSGQIMMGLGEFTRALDAFMVEYTRAEAAKDPGPAADARENIAWAHTVLGQYDQAEAEYAAALVARQSADRQRNLLFTRMNLVDVRSRMGLSEGVDAELSALRRALPADPVIRARFYIVEGFHALRRRDARRAFDAVTLADENGAGALRREIERRLVRCVSAHQLGHASSVAGDCERALKDAEANLALRLETTLGIAEAWLDAGRLEEARALLDRIGSAGKAHHEHRWRFLALSLATGEGRDRQTLMGDLTRETDRLRLTWKAATFAGWRRRPDVSWLLARAEMSGGERGEKSD